MSAGRSLSWVVIALGALLAPLAVPKTFAVDAMSWAAPGSACGEQPAGEREELVVWHPLGDMPQVAFDELVRAFDQDHADVELVVVKHDNYWEMLRAFAQIDDGQRPDVLLAGSGALLNLLSSGLTIAPGDCVASPPIDDWLPVVEATYTVDGELVAWPFNVSTPVVIYNAALADEAGAGQMSLDTLADLRAASDRVVASGVTTHGLVVTDQMGSWIVRQFSAQRGQLIGEPSNGRAGTPIERLTFANEAVAADFEWLRAGVASGAFLWIGGNPSGVDDLLRLTTESAEAVYTFHTSAALGDVITLVEAGAFPGSVLGVAPLPGGGGLVGGGALWLVAGRDGTVHPAAPALLDHLLSASSLAAFTAATGFVPPRMSAAQDPVLREAWDQRPELRVGYDQLVGIDGTPAAAGLAAIANDEIDRLLEWSVEDLLFSDEPVADVLAGVQERGQQLIESAAT